MPDPGGSPLFSFRALPIVVGLLVEERVDAQRVFRDAGLAIDVSTPELIAPLARVQRLLDHAAEETRRPAFGIDVAERVPSGTLGFTEFLMRSAPSVLHGLEVLCEFAPLINPILEFRLDASGRVARVHFVVPGASDALGVHLNEYTFALMFRQFAAVLGEWRAGEIWFAHERRDRDRVGERFGCPATFGAGDCGFAVERRALERKPPTADPVLFEFLATQARERLATLEPSNVAMVARTIESRLPNDVSIETIAAAMATTARSLQRHLANAGTSYRDVLAQVRRRRFAELARSGASDEAIAQKLGFADVKSMRRSLGAHTGRS